MKRRSFLKNIGSFGAAGLISPVLPLMPKKAFADHFPQLQFRNVAAANLPRYINVFLYGGPSELAGNLSNIEDINANSQNPYPNNLNPNDANTLVTANNLWSTAGGTIMEQMLASGDLSIYRTMNRRKDNNRAHGISVIQNLVGNLDVDTPGIATTLAWIIENNNPFGKAVDELLFPFITFEGESRAFKRVGHEVPVALKPLALNPNLSANVFNPYQRSNQTRAGLANGGARDLALEALALQTNEAVGLQMLGDGFIQRALYADRVDALFAAADIANAVTTYGYGDGNFGRRMSAAISLMLANQETVFVSLGSGGLGGWDDHSDAIVNYTNRMQELMVALQAAANHLNSASLAGIVHADKIIINVFGDFGRNVNMNDSRGWDHGNNQNLYTVGGKGLRALGKIVGRTKRIGDSGVNRQFTSPDDGSYEFEPFALASSMFAAYGVDNPEAITGEAPIDETQPGETLL